MHGKLPYLLIHIFEAIIEISVTSRAFQVMMVAPLSCALPRAVL
ncbi:hypothetical protein HMPREF0168_1815 [Bifidobacterium dentium ATCC 27679]|uniref:Uncharacterized protein n=1 Tax=Bifidobacterium dentium ATCC 27679 TaxID=871562 RepID=E0Q969_9BIFI|nr:hypothetical protein HMPREF0168_1815 [Bifidobacterium dentium ATCC 27679]